MSSPWETLAHVVLRCPRSAHARDHRHNQVAKLLTQKLAASGFTVEAEPAGVRRPDVVAYKPGVKAVIIDVTVVADLPGELSDAHDRKTKKYDDRQIRAWVARRSGVGTTAVSLTP